MLINTFKMKKALFIIFITLPILFNIGCDENPSNKANVSGGKTNEIIAVVKGPLTWQSKIGDTVKHFFEQPDTLLSQPEELFSLATITEKQFNESNFFFHHHNILIIHKDSIFSNPIIETKENQWATPQRVIWIKFSDDSSFYALFETRKETLLKMFDDMEILRTNQILQLGSNQSANLALENTFQFHMDIPAGFSIARSDSNFMWLSQTVVKKKQDMTASIIIWQRPYVSENQFSINELVKSRNEIASRYIPGPVNGSFMKTSVEYIAPSIKVLTNFPTGYAVEMRGLWDMVGDFMGGPFISYTFVNPNTSQLVTVEGFIYNPNHKKRIFLRQLQSVFYHLEIKQPQSEEK